MYACWKCYWCSLLFSFVWKSFTVSAIQKNKWLPMFWMDAIALVWMHFLWFFRTFLATIFTFKFGIHIIDVRIRCSPAQGISIFLCSWAFLGHPLYQSFVFIKWLWTFMYYNKVQQISWKKYICLFCSWMHFQQIPLG